MFNKDYHLLNEAYNKQIKEFAGSIGVQGDNAPGTGPSPVQLKKVEMPKHKCLYAAKGCSCNECEECKANQSKEEDCEECGGMCGIEKENTDSDTYMAKQLLFRIFKISSMLYGLMKSGSEVEAWVLSKITNAHDNLASAFNYKDFESFKEKLASISGLGQPVNVTEETEIDLFNAINSGGDALLRLIKLFLAKESKENKEAVLTEVIKMLDSK